MRLLVTGSSGLVGGEAVAYFDSQGHEVVGADNNMRKEFFGAQGNTTWNLMRIASGTKHYLPCHIDVRSEHAVRWLFEQHGPFDAVVHSAAQPSHDKAIEIPELDYEVNVSATRNLLDRTREFCPQAVFIFMSTNKVYGDGPNRMKFKELETRYDYLEPEDYEGVSESMKVEPEQPYPFGAHKAEADLMVRKYAKEHGMTTCVLRGGCLTGPGHAGVELHGFLSYLVRAVVNGLKYCIFGYQGKQVRDNLHSYDVARAIEQVILNPRAGEFYNLGGGRANSISIIEAIRKMKKIAGKKLDWEYVARARSGDHFCYISDMRKFQSHYPDWKVTKSLDEILEEIFRQWELSSSSKAV